MSNQAAKTIVTTGADIASVLVPGAALPIQIGRMAALGLIDAYDWRMAALGLIEAYDALMASRPADITVDQWRAILAGPVHSPGFVDSVVNEARSNQNQ